ncbi:MAG TPA: nucleotidyltransferase family protein [Kofleriaceae bacterium]|jgi:CTP:molybdopterin cytidylyltransferase MocA
MAAVRDGAVVLAAGAGTRLGGVAKALLLHDGVPFVERIWASLRSAFASDIVVVTRPQYQAALIAWSRGRVRVVVNEEPERGMGSSVAVGFGSLPSRVERAWLWPVDHPVVRVATLRTIANALGSHDVARPIFDGRGGHPPLVARALFAPLAGCALLPEGARSVLRAANTIDVAVNDPAVVRDIDTPADLEALQ